MKFKKRTLATTVAAATALGMGGPTWADGGAAAALFGGMIVGGAIQRNRQAERNSAYQSGYSQGQYQSAPPPQTVVVERPAQSGGSAEERIQNLDDLYKKGLITQQEYKKRRQDIIDTL